MTHRHVVIENVAAPGVFGAPSALASAPPMLVPEITVVRACDVLQIQVTFPNDPHAGIAPTALLGSSERRSDHDTTRTVAPQESHSRPGT